MIDLDESTRCLLLSANEEEYLCNLVGDFRARFPRSTIAECTNSAQATLISLIQQGWVELARTTWGVHSDSIVVSTAEALAVLESATNWDRPANDQVPCFHLLVTESGRSHPF